LEPLLSGFAAALRPGGWLILSGVLEAQLEVLTRRAREHGFEPGAVDVDGEWRSALLRRSP
jgi:ribosomal protein L11 methylase PrmA